jgi:phosphoglycolate phosphatase-like HAD superfamily hydrolase
VSADYRLAAYERHVEGMVRELRSLADRVEREARPSPRPGVTGTPRHLSAAESVNHAIVWGIANLGAYRLIEVAHHADVAESEAKP